MLNMSGGLLCQRSRGLTGESDGGDGGRVLVQSLDQAVASARVQDVDQTVPTGCGQQLEP